MKVLLLLLDGIADRGNPALGGKTPLQAAAVPNLDALAAAGSCASVYPLAPAAAVPDPARSTWELLGCADVRYPGRSGIEAAGAGVRMQPGEVAFRVDIAATMVDGGERYVQVSPVAVPERQAEELAEALSGFPPGPLGARLHHLSGASMVLVLGEGASDLVTGSDPVFYRSPVPPVRPLEGGGEAAERTAAELARFTEWASRILASHPVVLSREREGMTSPDFVLVSDPSSRPEAPPLGPTRELKAVMLASGPFFRGLAAVLELELMEMSSPEAGEDLYDKLLAARSALDGEFDLAVARSGAALEASRSGRVSRKVRVLEELDLAMSAVTEAFARDPDVVTVLCSGCTAPSVDTDEVLWSAEPVPAVLLGRNVRADRVERFDEICCASGGMGTIAGRDLLPLALGIANRAAAGSARPDPRRARWR